MLSSLQCLKKFGLPGIVRREGKYMVVQWVPNDLRAAMPALPAKIYCHRLLADPLMQALRNLVARGFAKELKTWDAPLQRQLGTVSAS